MFDVSSRSFSSNWAIGCHAMNRYDESIMLPDSFNVAVCSFFRFTQTIDSLTVKVDKVRDELVKGRPLDLNSCRSNVLSFRDRSKTKSPCTWPMPFKWTRSTHQNESFLPPVLLLVVKSNVRCVLCWSLNLRYIIELCNTMDRFLLILF